MKVKRKYEHLISYPRVSLVSSNVSVSVEVHGHNVNVAETWKQVYAGFECFLTGSNDVKRI